jgi:predicted nuclease with RNAse H fold
MEGCIEILKRTIVGIDFGSKFAGTSVICYNHAHQVRLISSSKNADADAFLLTELEYLQPDLVMIDAPLSLPGVYWLGNGYRDHFFRSCDRELQAMSPMFLGGLTARAMSLRKALNSRIFKEDFMGMLETYPRKLAEILGLMPVGYKERADRLPAIVEHLIEVLGVRINAPQVSTWHHLDALLAFLSGLRYLEKNSIMLGIPEEGTVVV